MSELVEKMRKHLQSTIDTAVERATGRQGRPAGTLRGLQAGGSAPGSTIPDSGAGRLNDPATGKRIMIWDIDAWDDANVIWGP